MSDSHHALSRGRELLAQLRNGHADAYLDIYRVLLPNRLTTSNIEPGLTDTELRRLRRKIVIDQTLECLAALEAGDPAQYLEIMKRLAILLATPEQVLERSHEQLLDLARTAARVKVVPDPKDPYDPSPEITRLDRLVWLDEDPSPDMRAAVPLSL